VATCVPREADTAEAGLLAIVIRAGDAVDEVDDAGDELRGTLISFVMAGLKNDDVVEAEVGARVRVAPLPGWDDAICILGPDAIWMRGTVPVLPADPVVVISVGEATGDDDPDVMPWAAASAARPDDGGMPDDSRLAAIGLLAGTDSPPPDVEGPNAGGPSAGGVDAALEVTGVEAAADVETLAGFGIVWPTGILSISGLISGRPPVRSGGTGWVRPAAERSWWAVG